MRERDRVNTVDLGKSPSIPLVLRGKHKDPPSLAKRGWGRFEYCYECESENSISILIT